MNKSRVINVNFRNFPKGIYFLYHRIFFLYIKRNCLHYKNNTFLKISVVLGKFNIITISIIQLFYEQKMNYIIINNRISIGK